MIDLGTESFDFGDEPKRSEDSPIPEQPADFRPPQGRMMPGSNRPVNGSYAKLADLQATGFNVKPDDEPPFQRLNRTIASMKPWMDKMLTVDDALNAGFHPIGAIKDDGIQAPSDWVHIRGGRGLLPFDGQVAKWREPQQFPRVSMTPDAQQTQDAIAAIRRGQDQIPWIIDVNSGARYMIELTEDKDGQTTCHYKRVDDE